VCFINILYSKDFSLITKEIERRIKNSRLWYVHRINYDVLSVKKKKSIQKISFSVEILGACAHFSLCQLVGCAHCSLLCLSFLQSAATQSLLNIFCYFLNKKKKKKVFYFYTHYSFFFLATFYFIFNLFFFFFSFSIYYNNFQVFTFDQVWLLPVYSIVVHKINCHLAPTLQTHFG
jgi:hypothetical protein